LPCFLIIIVHDLLHKTTSIHQVNVSQSYLYSAGLIKAKLKPYSKWNIKLVYVNKSTYYNLRLH